MQLWRPAHTFIISLTALPAMLNPLNIQTLFGETRPQIPRRIVSDWLENDCPAQDVSSLTGFKRMPTV